MMVLTRQAVRDTVLKLARNFEWPIKNRIFGFPPICDNPNGLPLIILTTPKCWKDSLWSAYSFLKSTPGAFKLKIYVDGEPSDEFRGRFRTLFPRSEILNVREALSPDDIRAPLFSAYIAQNRFGRKLALLYMEQRKGPFLFSDADILCFRPMDEVLSHITERPAVPLCIVGKKPELEWNDADILKHMIAEGIPVIPNFNSGFLYVPVDLIATGFIEECLQCKEDGRLTGHFIDQTVTMAIFSSAHCSILDPHRYLVTDEDMTRLRNVVDYTDVVLRHYVGTVRHKMYLEGIPEFLRRAKINS